MIDRDTEGNSLKLDKPKWDEWVKMEKSEKTGSVHSDARGREGGRRSSRPLRRRGQCDGRSIRR